eukprot:TRINITY_DN7542_c0_g1_i3.p1 TRINITY_DN7542_c0_g1~~TRINITY_DN7542_c0_g1_i3.p1  ORF type:complete len:215 (+),score=27.49 TRINITY_DN7542_c0_g1_i3:50-694(+)
MVRVVNIEDKLEDVATSSTQPSSTHEYNSTEYPTAERVGNRFVMRLKEAKGAVSENVDDANTEVPQSEASLYHDMTSVLERKARSITRQTHWLTGRYTDPISERNYLDFVASRNVHAFKQLCIIFLFYDSIGSFSTIIISPEVGFIRAGVSSLMFLASAIVVLFMQLSQDKTWKYENIHAIYFLVIMKAQILLRLLMQGRNSGALFAYRIVVNC